jgi:hypothetical protein
MFLTQQIKVNGDAGKILPKDSRHICAKMQLNVERLFVQSTSGNRYRDLE